MRSRQILHNHTQSQDWLLFVRCCVPAAAAAAVMSDSDEEKEVFVQTVQVHSIAAIAGDAPESSSESEPEVRCARMRVRGRAWARRHGVLTDSARKQTDPMPVLYLSHGGGPCFFMDAKRTPMFAGIDRCARGAQQTWNRHHAHMLPPRVCVCV